MEDKEREKYLTDWMTLLAYTCAGLKSVGWRERGGSDVWRYFSRDVGNETQSIKVFLNDYKNPTCIVVRYS